MTDKTNVTKRIEFAPAVAGFLAQDTLEARLGRAWVRFAEALLDRDPNRIDDVVTPDARFHELEAAGFARGPHGFKFFRSQMNAAFPDEHVVIVSMRFPEANIVETELACTATHLGELMGIPATGKRVSFTVYTRNRFEGDKMAERWDRADFADLLAQLRS